MFQFGGQGKNEGHMWKHLSCVVAVHIFGNGTRGGLDWFLCFSVDYRPIVVTAVDSCERRRHGWDRLASQARFSDQREKLNRLKGGFPYFKSAPLSVHLSSFDFHFYLGTGQFRWFYRWIKWPLPIFRNTISQNDCFFWEGNPSILSYNHSKKIVSF